VLYLGSDLSSTDNLLASRITATALQVLLACKNRPKMTYNVLSGTLSFYTTATIAAAATTAPK